MRLLCGYRVGVDAGRRHMQLYPEGDRLDYIERPAAMPPVTVA